MRRVAALRARCAGPRGSGAIVAVLALLAYATALGGGFVLDDHILIADNEAIRSAAHVPGYFARGMWPEEDLGAPDRALYRPLVMLAFFLVYQAAGLWPLAFHALNVALHAGNSVLVLALLRRLGGAAGGAALLGALVFAVHPVHVESVAWVSGISDLLATAFVLLAVWLYGHPSRRAYAGAVACAALALLSKEIGVAVPALALGSDWLRGSRVRWARVAGLVALVVAYLAVRQAALGAALNAPLLSLAAVLVAVDYALGYASMLVLPMQSGLFLQPPEQILTATTAAVAVAAVTGAIVWARRDRAVAFALVWFAASLAPALALVFNIGGTYAQRFLYLPSVAVALIAARVAVPLLARPRGAVVAAVAIAALGAATLAGAREWHDGAQVLARAIGNTPSYGGAHWALGHHHERAGRLQDAALRYREAARLLPPEHRAAAYNALGRLSLTAGDTERSLAFHQRALDAGPGRAEALVGIGNAHARRGDVADAARSFEAAWALDGRRWDALYGLALALEALGRPDESRRHLLAFAAGAPSSRFAAALADARRRLDPAAADREPPLASPAGYTSPR
jgi:tetratricopeptide (TPR) repeat protein